jgi:uncharacterized membrane protein
MSFEAVLGNKEYEFVVSEVTRSVVTRCSTSGVLYTPVASVGVSGQIGTYLNSQIGT